LRAALLATGIAEVRHESDPRDLMIGLALHHVVARQLGQSPPALFDDNRPGCRREARRSDQELATRQHPSRNCCQSRSVLRLASTAPSRHCAGRHHVLVRVCPDGSPCRPR
jgi:hypothetical protein